MKKTTTSDVLVTALGLAIQNRRRELRLSQDELAVKAGLHRTYISEIERRSRNLSVKILVCIARALEMEPSELMRTAEGLAADRGTIGGSSEPFSSGSLDAITSGMLFGL